MDKRGREERGGEGGEGERKMGARDGSMHPLEFLKVGAYDMGDRITGAHDTE